MADLTTKDILMQLPEEARELAIANTAPHILDAHIQPGEKPSISLRKSFVWDKSPQGDSYWQGIFEIQKRKEVING